VPVLSVTETQDVDLAGTLHDYYEIVFTVSGRPGSFTIRVPKDGDPVAAAQAAISAEAATVAALYGL
jgi:hypothetical protein